MSHAIDRAEMQYLAGLQHIYDNGVDLPNERTGIACRTVINIDMTYDATTNKAPIVTTRKAPVKLPIAEMLGYIKGVTSAAQMRALGTKSWDANANENQAWLNSPYRKGEDDLGLIYGAVAKNWPVRDDVNPDNSIDLFHKVYNNLKAGKDDRGEIITFWNPGMFYLGCLRPCMYEHQFSLLGDDLYLNSTQRSSDWPLGTVANMVQVWLLLRLMAQITGKNPKYAHHRNVNCHIYGNQLDLVQEQLDRPILAEPTIDINPDIKTLADVESWVTVNDFEVKYTAFHPPIQYPFAV
jgi:thymidylate synthase